MTMFLAILAVLLVLPGAAAADPVSSAIFTFLASSGVAVGTATAIATFATRALVSLGFSLLGQLFQEKPKVKQRGIQTEQTTTGDTTPLTFIVGRFATEGHLIAPGYSRGKNNKILTYIVDVSDIPVTGLSGRVAINGEWTNLVQASDDPSRLDFDDFGYDEAGNPYGWMWFLDGTQTTAFDQLTDRYSDHPDRPWTTDHILEGSAYAVMEFVFNREIYSGFPRFRFEVDGIPLYDPRKDSTVGGSGSHRWGDTSTWEFTKNPQVINYNILRGITLPNGDIYGGLIPAEDLPLDNWFAAMNACDALIGSRPTYEAGFEIDVSQEPFDVIKEMNKASFAQMSELGGVFKVRVGAPASPVLSITDDDIVITKPADLNPFPGLAQTSNAITGTYVEPNDVWQGRAADPIYNPTWETDDGGRRLTDDVGLPAVSNKSQAQHLLNSYINDNRRFATHGLVLPASFATLEPLDTIEWTSERNGYIAKVFEVVELEDHLDTMLQYVRVREREETDTNWSSGDDVPDPSPFNDLSDPDRITPDITVTAVDQQDGDGQARRAAIQIDWPVDESTADFLEYQVRLLGASGSLTTSASVGREAGKAVTSDGIIGDENYEVRARYTPAPFMDWSAWVPVTTSDTRLSAKDIVDALNEKIDTAFERHDAALDTVESGAVFQLLQEVRIQDAILAAQNVSDEAQQVVAFEQTGDNAAAIVSEQTARADADSAIASDVTALTARTDTAESNISDLQTVKVDASGAVAAVETEISAEYNALTAMASATGFAEATADNISAGYVWRVNGSNLLELVSTQEDAATGPTSTFKIDADYVQITGLTQMDQAVIDSLAVDNGFISNLTVDTLNIAGNAVSTSEYHTSGSTYVGDGTYDIVFNEFVFAPADTVTRIFFAVDFEHGYSGQRDWSYIIEKYDGSYTTLKSRADMAEITDYATVTGIVELDTTGSGVSSQVGLRVKWRGEAPGGSGNEISLQSGTTLSMEISYK